MKKEIHPRTGADFQDPELELGCKDARSLVETGDTLGDRKQQQKQTNKQNIQESATPTISKKKKKKNDKPDRN